MKSDGGVRFNHGAFFSGEVYQSRVEGEWQLEARTQFVLLGQGRFRIGGRQFDLDHSVQAVRPIIRKIHDACFIELNVEES